MTVKYAVAVKNTRMDAVTLAIDVGTAGFLRIYDGTQPTNPDTALGAQVLLAELTLSLTSFGASAAGVITAAAITRDENANASGTATWYTLTTSAGVRIVDGPIADLNLDTNTIIAGQPVEITSFTLTHGAG